MGKQESEAVRGEGLTFRLTSKVTSPLKPLAHYFGFISMNAGLLWGIVACCFGLLGFHGKAWTMFVSGLKRTTPKAHSAVQPGGVQEAGAQAIREG